MNLLDGRLLRTPGGVQVILSEGLHIPIPEKGQKPALVDGQKVVFGIRTESIRPLFTDCQPAQAGEWSTNGLVEVVEPLGGETHLHTDIFGIKFTARCDGRQRISAGTDMPFAFRLDAIHLFDAETRQAIY